ncbi:MAG: hypothetical protein ACRD21_21465, partial [Vicinamibacteria bacterium]
MSDFQDVICPSCQKPHLVDTDELPVEGEFRACPHCGTSIRVSRDVLRTGGVLSAAPPRTVAAVAAVGEEEGEESLAVFLKMPSGGIERVSSHAIEQGIQMRRILPWDLVSDDNRDFEQASERADLRRLFLPGDFVPHVQNRCANHPDALPAATCRKCGRSYCSTCVSSLFRIQPRLCPACNGPITEPDPRLREIPPWRRLPEVARFPIADHAWIATLAIGLILFVAGYRSPYTLPLNLLALPILLGAVLRSARGSIHPNLDLGGLLRETFPIAVLSAVIAVPFLLIPWVLGPVIGVLVQFPLTLFLFFYYPMAVALLLVSENKDQALKPRTVFRAIWGIRDEYFVYIALFIAVAVALVAVLLVASFLPWIRSIVHAVALAYA